MKKVMIVLFSYLGVENVLNFTFKGLKEGNDLIIFGVVEKDLPKVNKLISNTTLGEKLTKKLEKDIIEVYKQRANEALQMGLQKGKKEKINTKIKLINTTSICSLSDIINIEEIDHLIINYTRERFFEKFILDCSLNNILDELEIPYTLFHDGKKCD